MAIRLSNLSKMVPVILNLAILQLQLQLQLPRWVWYLVMIVGRVSILCSIMALLSISRAFLSNYRLYLFMLLSLCCIAFWRSIMLRFLPSRRPLFWLRCAVCARFAC